MPARVLKTREPAIHTWKLPHMLKGALTWIPPLNALRLRRAATGGSDSSRYCYSVWLRHLRILDRYGFKVGGARIGELGPGDSIGIGLASLLSGAECYIGLDIVPFSAKADLPRICDELVQLYSRREPIPNDAEFPAVAPKLDSYEYPDHLIEHTNLLERGRMIRHEIESGLNGTELVRYRAPWASQNDMPVSTLDLIFSQAVLEHVDSLQEAYHAMFGWLKPKGYASHVIGFWAHQLSPFWNGHWAYSDWQWKLVRGRREFLLNREPLSTHLACAQKAGFEILLSERNYDDTGLEARSLARKLDSEDARTHGVVLILRKP